MKKAYVVSFDVIKIESFSLALFAFDAKNAEQVGREMLESVLAAREDYREEDFYVLRPTKVTEREF